MADAFREGEGTGGPVYVGQDPPTRIVQLFEELHRKKKLITPNRLLNVFAPTHALEDGQQERTI